MGRNVKKPVRRRGAKRQAERRGGRKKKRVAFDVVTTTILIVAICVFAFSLFQLVKMLIPYYSGGKEYDKLKDKAITIETTKDSEDTSEARFKVDFDVLLQENPDTVAWIRFDEPSIISYPVVKSADNKEYLTKTFTESDNKLGAIFMDMRNTSDFSDKNTMIYGHNMKNTTMFSQLEKAIMLRVVDNKWMEHLDNMDMLREGIGLRAYGQKNPLVEYKFEAYDMFQHMIESIQDETIMALYKIRAQLIQEIEEPVDHLEGAQSHHEDVLEPQNID